MIELRVLGGLDLAGPDAESTEGMLAQPRPAALLTYLAVAKPGHFFRRDYLAGLFWPETGQERARTNLRKLIFTLRRVLGAEIVEARGDDDVRVDPSALWCDAAEFSDAMKHQRYSRAVELYRGSLLPGFHAPEARGFQDWLDTTRSAFARDAVKAALALAAAHATNRERTDVGDLVQFVLRLDSEIEDEHQLRKLLDLLEQIGDRSSALRLYESFRQRMWSNYKALPSADTRAVVERLKS